jgi:hypothetical protein
MFARPIDDAGYFHVRALEEQVAAQNAVSPAARIRHDELAAMYRFKEALLKACEASMSNERVEGLVIKPSVRIGEPAL